MNKASNLIWKKEQAIKLNMKNKNFFKVAEINKIEN